jgi:DNA-binding NarL/FixJ family response regulator
LVAAGLSNDDIASQLNLSSRTGKTHVDRAMTKLVGHDGAQLVVIAWERRLVDPYR